MKYYYKKGTVERDLLIITLIWLMAFLAGTTAYFMLRTYIAEGRLQNNVCERQIL